jgi:protein involved in polysaccharide export with SLBB domain
MTVLDDKVALEAGDRISFRVIEDRDDAVPRLVTDTGEVDFPYVGRLKVAGLTCRQVAEQLKKLLEVDYYKRATVIVGLDVIVGNSAAATQETARIAWIVGQVHQEGPQELPKLLPLTVSQIILRAGGFGDFADERKVRLVHRATAPSSSVKTTDESLDADSAPEGQVVDVKSVFEGRSTLDPIVQPNDLIIVPKRLINF